MRIATGALINELNNFTRRTANQKLPPHAYRNFMLALAGFLFATTMASAKPAQVILIRHAEKPDDEIDQHLSTRGKERAAALTPYFMHGEFLPKVDDLRAIYAQKPPHPKVSSLRAIETVQGLADALKLKVLTPWKRDEYKELVKEIMQNPRYDGKTVLICWEHAVLVDIAREFKPENPPADYPGKRFDRTWIITFDTSGKATFKNLPQRLMFGDSAD
jgi:hypothetical protein